MFLPAVLLVPLWLYLLIREEHQKLQAPHIDAARQRRRTRVRRWVGSLLCAVVLTTAIRVVIEPFRATTDAVAPEITKGSTVFVLKYPRNYSPGDIVAYRSSVPDTFNLGRVIELPGRGELIIARRNEEPQPIAISSVVGKVVFNTRISDTVNEADSAELTQKGWNLWQERKLGDAATKFKKAVDLNPTNAEAWNGLGWATFNAGDKSAAEQAFRRALSINAKHPGALNGIGQIALAERRYDEAEKSLLAASPQASAAWFGLARLYLVQGKFTDAEQWLQKIVDSGEANEMTKQMLDAAKAKRLPDHLRLMLEPPAGSTIAE
jgi:hypothetical protein